MSFDSILSKCKNVFEGNSCRLSESQKKKPRALSFDKETVINTGKNFDVVSEIRIEEKEAQAEPEDSEDKARWDEWTNGKDVAGNGSNGGGTGGKDGN
jgi:hypothetical protein